MIIYVGKNTKRETQLSQVNSIQIGDYIPKQLSETETIDTGKIYTYTTDKTYMFYGESDEIVNQTIDETANEEIASKYPIGSIYTSNSSENPSEIIQGTTWELISKKVIDTGWQDFSWTNSTYVGTTQSAYTQNKWRVKENILYIQVGAGATATINTGSEDELARIPIKGNTSFDTTSERIWIGAVGGSGSYGGMLVIQNESYISVHLKPHTTANGQTAPWFSTHFTVPLDSSFTFVSGSYEMEYKWERVS